MDFQKQKDSRYFITVNDMDMRCEKREGFFPMESLISPIKEKNYGQLLLLESIWNRPITAFVVL